MNMKIKNRIQFSDKVKPGVLGSDFIDGGVELTLNGWGVISNTGINNTIPSNKLQARIYIVIYGIYKFDRESYCIINYQLPASNCTINVVFIVLNQIEVFQDLNS